MCMHLTDMHVDKHIHAYTQSHTHTHTLTTTHTHSHTHTHTHTHTQQCFNTSSQNEIYDFEDFDLCHCVCSYLRGRGEAGVEGEWVVVGMGWVVFIVHVAGNCVHECKINYF